MSRARLRDAGSGTVCVHNGGRRGGVVKRRECTPGGILRAAANGGVDGDRGDYDPLTQLCPF